MVVRVGVALPMLVFVVLAGCAGVPGEQDLRAVFGDANVRQADVPAGFLGNGVALNLTFVGGLQLEGRLAGGAFADAAAIVLEGGDVQGPRMMEPAPTGGGGDRQAFLPLPGQELEVRLRRAADLAGLHASWYVLREAEVGGPLPGPAARQPASEPFVVTLAGPGAFVVGVILYGGADDPVDAPVAVLTEGFKARIQHHYTARGAVQPVRPGGTVPVATPSATAREQMADAYALALPNGTTVVAKTAFDGAPGDGTDVDLGLYDPAGVGVACTGSGSPTLPLAGAPDPGQAEETVEAQATVTGAWTVEVGAMQDGCGGFGGWYYNNAAPVPYALDVLAG